MSKLIKAEFYRVSHSGIFLKILIVFGLLPTVMPFLSLADMEQKNLYQFLIFYSEFSGVIITGYFGIVVSAMASNLYYNRMHYYEIMDGANTHHIILSKLIVYNVFSIAVLIIPPVIVYSIVGNKYGIGEMKELWLTVLLGIVIILNITCIIVFISMIIRHILAAPILIYTLSMLPLFAYMMIIETADMTGVSKFIVKAMRCIPTIQITEFVKADYSTGFVATVIGSFVVFFVGLYTLTYISYKKKNFR
ncbi:MAG: hypothetical protein E7506_03095 [Ruminococcus sp.]|nr:hypothetical protein [Ruminococcus sp.]